MAYGYYLDTEVYSLLTSEVYTLGFDGREGEAVFQSPS
jgi:hypothetical protein